MPDEAITVYGKAANFVNIVSDNLMFKTFISNLFQQIFLKYLQMLDGSRLTIALQQIW